MITLIAGKPGVGKTALLTYFAILDMTVNAFERVKRTNAFIGKLNAGGYNFKYAQRHLVYSNYDITSHMKGYVPRRSYDMEGFEFGLPDKAHPTKFIYRYSSLFFTESQAFLNSRKSKSFRDSVSRAYEQHRHWDLDVYLDAQRATLIDLNVRELSSIIYVDELEVKEKNNKIVKCVWHCRKFLDVREYDKFDGNSKTYECVKVSFKYDGDIFRCYDSQMNSRLFLQGREKEDFYCSEYTDAGYSLDEVKDFCNKKSIDLMYDYNYWK